MRIGCGVAMVKKKKVDKIEQEAIQDENISILFIIVILVLCFIAGISLGYCLYKLALNSAIIMIK